MNRRSLLFVGRREAAAHDVFGDRAREEEVLEVALAAGLGAAAGHLEAAERVALDDGAGAAAVEIELPTSISFWARSSAFGLRENRPPVSA